MQALQSVEPPEVAEVVTELAAEVEVVPVAGLVGAGVMLASTVVGAVVINISQVSSSSWTADEDGVAAADVVTTGDDSTLDRHSTAAVEMKFCKHQ